MAPTPDAMSPAVVLALIVGFVGFVLVQIWRRITAQDTKQEVIVSHQHEKKKEPKTKSKKQQPADQRNWRPDGKKGGYNPPWLVTALKGHTGPVLNIDFSSNGKYLASCGEEDPDPDPDADTSTDNLSMSSISSSSSECGSSSSTSNKENEQSQSPDPSPRTNKGLSRRQRKNNRRRENASPEKKNSKQVKSNKDRHKYHYRNKMSILAKREEIHPKVLKQYLKLNLSEREYYEFLLEFILSKDQQTAMGYPHVLNNTTHVNHNLAVFFHQNYASNRKLTLRVNAREFVPRPTFKSSSKPMYPESTTSESSETDSSLGSSEDLLRSVVSQSDFTYNFYIRRHVYAPPELEQSFERICVRCAKGFFVTETEYLTQERCRYHWGKLQTNHKGDKKNQPSFTCCQGTAESEGCSHAKLHVWNGSVPGKNGPVYGYVHTMPSRMIEHKVYALDCEMSYTVAGLEATRVTVVGMKGELVYNVFILPPNEIVDYNTRFSGITPSDMQGPYVKSLKQVQSDLLSFISSETILIGHGLENDLKALKIVHKTVVDTAATFPHFRGLPYKMSLKSLANTYLNLDIQCSGATGHNSYEDACAAMELMLWRVRKNLKFDY